MRFRVKLDIINFERFDVVMPSIISISGERGSGKDTIASILVDEYGFQKLAFADSVKDSLSVIFGWDRIMLEGIGEVLQS